MFAGFRRGRIATGIVAMAAVAALVGCSSGNPLEDEGPGETTSAPAETETIVVGSAAFPENEIIAQIYAQALEANGVDVETKLSIGQRDVYLAALQDGSIDLIPEYSGNLLQYFDSSTTANSSEDVSEALATALPEGLEVLDEAQAQNADSYNVTKEFSTTHNVTSLADLAGLNIPLSVAANPEFAERPYGIPGLEDVYGVQDVTLTPISDNSGPLTLKALLDGEVQLADIYSTTPSIAENDLVTLDDPKNMILAQNVVPLISSAKVSENVAMVLNTVSASLTTEDLIRLNGLNQGDEKLAPERLATDWLAEKNLF